MELTNTFTVDSPLEVAWPVLCDIERIAPCMPGAQLQEVEGSTYRGEVKVKVGPISARFRGTAEMVERDDDAHRAVIEASGRDAGGKGNASATITATAEAVGEGACTVTVSTDLRVTGKVAQFGRSAMADVSTKLLGQFVDCLQSRVLAGDTGADENGAEAAAGAGGGGTTSPAATAPAPTSFPGGVEAGTAATGGGAGDGAATSGSGDDAAGRSGPRRIEGPEAEPVDLLEAAGPAVARRAAPVAGVVVLVLLLWWWRRRR